MPLLRFRCYREDRRTYAVLCPTHQLLMREAGWRLEFYTRPAPGDACDLCAGLTTDLG